jgi:hypothetical protein
MEVWRKENEVGLGDLVRVELDSGHTHFQAPEALDVRYAQAIREFCQQEGIWPPDSFKEYEQAAARATFARMAEENQTLDILASREALRSMPDGGYGYEYSEGYNPYTSSYVCQQCSYIGQDRYEQSLVVSLEDGTATVNSTWGSMSYWDRFVYPPQGEPYYAGTVDDPYRQPPSWAVEKSRQAEATWEPQP